MPSPSLRDPRLNLLCQNAPGAATFAKEQLDHVREVLTDIAGGRYWRTTEAFELGWTQDIARDGAGRRRASRGSEGPGAAGARHAGSSREPVGWLPVPSQSWAMSVWAQSPPADSTNRISVESAGEFSQPRLIAWPLGRGCVHD